MTSAEAVGRIADLTSRLSSATQPKHSEKTYEQFLYQILRMLIKPFGESVLEFLDLLPCQVLREPLKCKAARDHLVDNATQGPEVGAVTTLT